MVLGVDGFESERHLEEDEDGDPKAQLVRGQVEFQGFHELALEQLVAQDQDCHTQHLIVNLRITIW